MKVARQIVTIIAVVCIIMANVALPASADVVEFNEAAKLGASIIDLYGMANNTNLAYEVASDQSALTVIENLYTEYSNSASDPYTLAAIGAAAAAAGAVAVIYDAITGQGYIQLYQEQYISSLDGYWDYQLLDAGFVRDQITDLFSWTLNQSDGVDPISIYVETNYKYGQVTLHNLGDAPLYYIQGTDFRGFGKTPLVHYCVVTNGTETGNPNQYGTAYYSKIYLMSLDPFTVPVLYSPDHGLNYNVIDHVSGTFYNDQYYYSLLVSIRGYQYYDGTFPDLTYDTIFGQNPSYQVTTDDISIEPYWGDPLERPVEITIADPANPDYQEMPVRITTTMPIPDGVEIPLPEGVSTPEYGVPYPITDASTLNQIVPDLWENLVANEVGIQEAPEPVTPSVPSEVYIPFLPVALPNFNFSLSGIWHYVREWIASLGAWFTMVLTVWNNLPYAMVVPVYATMVVLIVLGVYKRFFM